MPIEDGGAARSRRAERRRRAARESHRAIERHGDLRRQGHRESVLEVRPARPRLLLPRLRPTATGTRCGRRRPTPGQAQGVPTFGRAAAVYNVIDSRQSYLQQLLKQALATMGFTEQADAVDALLVRDGRALARDRARARLRGQPSSSGKPFVEVSGRKGLGVKADDLLDRLIDTAGREVAHAQPRARRGRSRGAWPRPSRSRPCATS